MATQEEVDRICEAIIARGERPTVERVRVELGGGSPNSLTPLVRAWNDARRQLALPTSKPVAPPDTSGLPPTLQRAMSVMNVAMNAAVAEIMTTERRLARTEIDQAVAEAQRQVEDARHQIDDERMATEAVRVEVIQLERALAEKSAEIADFMHRLETAQSTINDLRVSTAAAEQRAEGERQRAVRAEAEAEAARKERMDGEVVVREATERAAKAEGQIAALQDELAAHRGRRGGRTAGTR